MSHCAAQRRPLVAQYSSLRAPRSFLVIADTVAASSSSNMSKLMSNMTAVFICQQLQQWHVAIFAKWLHIDTYFVRQSLYHSTKSLHREELHATEMLLEKPEDVKHENSSGTGSCASCSKDACATDAVLATL
jgi:hypothetical protein